MTSTRQVGKLGRLPYSPSTPKIVLQARHFGAVGKKVPAAPPRRDNLGPVAKAPGGMPMYDNDQYGDCVWAMIGHDIQLKTLLGAGREVTVATEALLKGYSDVTGFDPDDPSTDNGTSIQDALDYWRKTGIQQPDGTYNKIVAFAEVPHTNRTLLTQALNVFGSLLVGVNLPDSAMDQFSNQEPWTVVPDAEIDGGHAVLCGAYNLKSAKNMETTVGTWGAEQSIADAWWAEYVEEAWVVVSRDWINSRGVTAQGFNWNELESDFVSITGAPFPKLTPPVSTPPAPPAPANAPVASPPDAKPVGWDEFVGEAEAWLQQPHFGANADFAQKLAALLKANQA